LWLRLIAVAVVVVAVVAVVVVVAAVAAGGCGGGGQRPGILSVGSECDVGNCQSMSEDAQHSGVCPVGRRRTVGGPEVDGVVCGRALVGPYAVHLRVVVLTPRQVPGVEPPACERGTERHCCFASSAFPAICCRSRSSYPPPR